MKTLFFLILVSCSVQAKPWIWYAPWFNDGSVPNQTQMGWYFSELKNAGITVVGVDVGESYGSPQGRQQFENYYQRLQETGYDKQGCMLLQSRGALMGYNWIMDHPGRIKCVAAIYPLLTVKDYIGIPGAAKAWNVLPEWLLANMTTQSPLERADRLEKVNVLHLHGDADYTVPMKSDQEFISNLDHGKLIVIPKQGHEPHTPEFFHSAELLKFLIDQ